VKVGGDWFEFGSIGSFGFAAHYLDFQLLSKIWSSNFYYGFP